MNAEDKAHERRSAYLEYISILNKNKGRHTEESLQKLKESFDVTEDDIISMANDVALDGHIDLRKARFTLLMEDLRDYRDVAQIKADRKSIIKEALSENRTVNEGYLFLG